MPKQAHDPGLRKRRAREAAARAKATPAPKPARQPRKDSPE
ncbi:hypothetical protein [Sinomonas atrocyanea]|nr:hypothetical protein [Sinomonas atrocyanea]MDR6623045.1 hypothetical protein [Sinomonas atrocyanea]